MSWKYWVIKLTLVYLLNAILLSHKRKENTDPYNSMDACKYIDWKKSDSKKHILYNTHTTVQKRQNYKEKMDQRLLGFDNWKDWLKEKRECQRIYCLSWLWWCLYDCVHLHKFINISKTVEFHCMYMSLSLTKRKVTNI